MTSPTKKSNSVDWPGRILELESKMERVEARAQAREAELDSLHEMVRGLAGQITRSEVARAAASARWAKGKQEKEQGPLVEVPGYADMLKTMGKTYADRWLKEQGYVVEELPEAKPSGS